jgi:hypothetical protein
MNENIIIASKVAAINQMHSFINGIVPKLIDMLKQGYKCKKDGSLFDKDARDLQGIINNGSVKLHSAFVDSNGYSVVLRVKNAYKTGEYSCNYVERSVWLCSYERIFEEFTPFCENMTESYYKNIQDIIEEKQEMIDKLQGEIMTAKREIYL